MPHTTETPEVFQRLRDEAGWSIFLDDFSEGTKYWYAKNVRAPRHGIDILEPSPPTGRITVIVYFGEHFVNANGLLLSACFEAAQRALFLRFKDLVDASLDTFGNPEVADILQGMATLADLHALFERTPEQRKKLPPPPPPVLADREGLREKLAVVGHQLYGNAVSNVLVPVEELIPTHRPEALMVAQELRLSTAKFGDIHEDSQASHRAWADGVLTLVEAHLAAKPEAPKP